MLAVLLIALALEAATAAEEPIWIVADTSPMARLATAWSRIMSASSLMEATVACVWAKTCSRFARRCSSESSERRASTSAPGVGMPTKLLMSTSTMLRVGAGSETEPEASEVLTSGTKDTDPLRA